MKKRGYVEGVRRLVRYRLLIPVARSLSDPKEVARGVSLGLGLGLTPTVGLQITMVMTVWFVMKYVLKLRVDVLSALAWTWVSNPITMIPMYFVFYLTGELMLFRGDETIGYESFSGIGSGLLSGDISLWMLWDEMLGIAFPMFLGSVPWSLGGFVGGYFLGKGLVERVKKRKRVRSERAG